MTRRDGSVAVQERSRLWLSISIYREIYVSYAMNRLVIPACGCIDFKCRSTVDSDAKDPELGDHTIIRASQYPRDWEVCNVLYMQLVNIAYYHIGSGLISIPQISELCSLDRAGAGQE